jgi:hypothetical protein
LLRRDDRPPGETLARVRLAEASPIAAMIEKVRRPQARSAHTVEKYLSIASSKMTVACMD